MDFNGFRWIRSSQKPAIWQVLKPAIWQVLKPAKWQVFVFRHRRQYGKILYIHAAIVVVAE